MHRRCRMGSLALAVACALPIGAAAQVPAESSHMTLVGHVDMTSGGEGFAMKVTGDGHRLLYVAHESGPHCFSIVDVTNPAQPSLIRTSDDFPWRPSKKRATQLSDLRFGELFDAHIQTLATTLRPGTIAGYRITARRFLSYLQTDFPHLQQLAELRRDPHLFGWFRRLCQQEPSLSNTTRQAYLLQLRRLLDDLAFAGHPLQPGLILTEDLPPRPQYLPSSPWQKWVFLSGDLLETLFKM